ncbi:LysR substrate-binding domain-containing protein [Bordetella genomosp. 6]|uniref:LysR family transcriptional regulator n=1 Tax=Bordetella genomosp. 6 TaxID=463024 RepID=A0ABX4F9Q7_9BORD|nr:LysR substrate-binding domain-containing protein [Bordetella genomosp. 6]OZI73287.1 LysR family transcriptional regulator [Bordetella genomosp. 6]
MELRQLRYFVAVAEALHFGRAARRLSISQPPLSFNIARLEESLGYALLRRSTRAVELTAAGKVFYQEACRILALADQARALGQRAARGEVGSLRVGFVGASLLSPMAKVLRQFEQDRPGLMLSVHELNSFEQIHALQREQIDFGIMHPRSIPDGIRAQLLHREPFVCALPDSHPLAARQRIRLQALRDEPFVLFPRHFSPEYHDQIIALCMDAGFTPHIRYEVRANATVVALVAAGFGVAIVPRSVSRVAIDGIQFRPLAKAGVESQLLGVWRDDGHDSLIQPLLAAMTPLLPAARSSRAGPIIAKW